MPVFETLTRREIRAVLKRHKGSMSRIAEQLGHTSHVSVSLWLKGKHTSQPIKEAATAKALELLEQERRAAV